MIMGSSVAIWPKLPTIMKCPKAGVGSPVGN